MSNVRWKRADALFHAALERDAGERETFLREACGEDEALYAEVVSLIAADEGTPGIALERLATVHRDLRHARAWLRRELSGT